MVSTERRACCTAGRKARPARVSATERGPRSVAGTLFGGSKPRIVEVKGISVEAELGPLGLMDDLYAAAYAYRMLRRELPGGVLRDAWQADEDAA